MRMEMQNTHVLITRGRQPKPNLSSQKTAAETSTAVGQRPPYTKGGLVFSIDRRSTMAGAEVGASLRAAN